MKEDVRIGSIKYPSPVWKYRKVFLNIFLCTLLIVLSSNLYSQIYLNLSVDMRSQTVSPNGVHVAGTFNSWDPASLLMEDNDNDGIYRISIAATAQTYQYKFVNGNAWGHEEVVIGSCVTGTNRLATVSTASVTMPTVCFGYCSADCISTEKRLACVGNSITYGHGVSDLNTKTWPAVLKSMLGAGYYTENLGVSGRTMLKTGDAPYWNEPQFKRVFDMQADVVFIKLGTNDSKSWNWTGKSAQFKADCISMIDTFRHMASKPEVYLLTPATAFSTAYAIDENVIKNEMIPILRQVAKEKGVNVIDIQTATAGLSQYFPDGVHPNDEGTRLIAVKIYNLYTATKPVINVNGTNLSVTNVTGVAYQWYVNGNVISGATSSTYIASANGKYFVSVKLSSSNDDILNSNTVTIGGQANVAPTVSITSPANNSNIFSGNNIVISANAIDNDGSVSKVEFFNGTVKLGEDLTSPFTYTWTAPAIGTYSLTAKATDNSGASTTSAAVSVTVKVNQLPTVSITSPTNNTVITTNSATISASASDADGSISKVDFYSGSTLLGSSSTSPYTFSWNPANGSYVLSAKATDNAGGVATSSNINVTVNVPAKAIPGKIESENWNSMSGVQTEATTDAGGGLNVGWIDANDWMDYYVNVATAGIYTVDFRISSNINSQIQILSGTTSLGTLTMPNTNGNQNWQTASMNVNLSAGNQTIRILALTNGFNINWMNFAKANTPPVVSLTAPLNAAIITTTPVTVSANATDADGTISKVEFYSGVDLIGTDNTSPYSISWTPINGTYAITAKAYDNGGAITTSSAANVTVGLPISIPAKIEAEAWTSMSGVQTEACAEGGSDVGYFDNGDWIDYLINVPTAGSYSVDLRIASTVATAQIQLKSGSTVLSTVTLPNTNGWQNWQTVSTTVSLSAGNQTIRLFVASSGFNLNWLNFIKANAVPTASITSPANGSTFTSVPLTITANASDSDGSISKVEFFNGSTLIGTSTASPYSISWSPANGSYSLTAKATDNGGATKTSTVVTITVNIPVGLPIPGKIESENWSSQSGMQTETTTDAGGGLNVGWIDANDWIDYVVYVATTGTYTVQFRIASVAANTQCQLLSGSTVLSTVNMPNTGGAQTWTTVSSTVSLTAGSQTIRFLAKTNSFNINWMNFTFTAKSADALPTQIAEKSNSKFEVFPNPSKDGFINITSSELSSNEKLSVVIYTIKGEIIYKNTISANEIGSVNQKIQLGYHVPDAILFLNITGANNTYNQKLLLK